MSNYPQWVANIVPVPKKDGKVRMCVDYRDLNRASPKDNFPLPHIDMLVDNTACHAFFSFMDGFSRYNQILMAEDDREKTTFVTLWGTFCYKVMPFGLKNAGATYQRAMVTLFHDMMHKEIEVYVDDMIAKSRTLKQHIEDLRKLFSRLCKYRLKLNPAKCTFGVKSGKLLGFMVSERGIEVDPIKVKAIREMPPPTTDSEVRGFLGCINFVARFISQLTVTCNPIFKLLRKRQKFEWDIECQGAFERIKQYLERPLVLVPAIPGKPLILYVTVLDESMDEIGKERAIYYLSKKFTDCEKRYPALEQTCCALVWAAKRLRPYMLSHAVWLVAKTDPIQYILEKPALIGRIARWQPLAHEFPDEHIMLTDDKPQPGNEWTMWFDGASNILGNGIGVVLASPIDQYFPFAARLGFDYTNNMVEYEAFTMGLSMALEHQVKRLRVYGDSALVIYQLYGEWETRDIKLIPYHNYVKEMIEAFDVITFHHVTHDENQMADALETLSAMVWVNEGQEMTIHVWQQPRMAYCQQLSLEVERADQDPWYLDIKRYLEKGEYPKGASENSKRTLRRLAAGYLMSGSVLYKRNADMTLLRCVDRQEAERIIEEVHDGTFGTHPSGHTLARKILRVGLPPACAKVPEVSDSCRPYQGRPSTLHSLTSPWPFSMWGIDVIGPIEPKASNGHRFILVAIDYFTKWVEAASYSTVTCSVVVKFIKRDIICRYGIPAHVITDNDTNLTNKMMTDAEGRDLKYPINADFVKMFFP
ncbi:Retrovirus-related Pol polyprotein, partial [Mucuna pruriens]